LRSERQLGATRLAEVVKKHRFWWLGAALLFATGAARAEKAPESASERAADKLLVGIPVAAFALTFVLDDLGDGEALGFNVVHMTGSPRHDLGLALMRAGVVTYGLKSTVAEERPNGEDDNSFPSGHTAIAFTGAEFIRNEYGWAWGAPAYAAASFVGWSRVDSRDHWTHDVAVGAMIGILSNHDLGGMDTRWGGLRLKPALFSASPAHMPGTPEVPDTAPGLKLEFRF
jgi:membrane-associated phospholipid phosphatase